MERGDMGAASPVPSPSSPPPHSPTIFEQNIFFLVKSENIHFLYVNKMWDFTLFIEQDICDEK